MFFSIWRDEDSVSSGNLHFNFGICAFRLSFCRFVVSVDCLGERANEILKLYCGFDSTQLIFCRHSAQVVIGQVHLATCGVARDGEDKLNTRRRNNQILHTGDRLDVWPDAVGLDGCIQSCQWYFGFQPRRVQRQPPIGYSWALLLLGRIACTQ